MWFPIPGCYNHREFLSWVASQWPHVSSQQEHFKCHVKLNRKVSPGALLFFQALDCFGNFDLDIFLSSRQVPHPVWYPYFHLIWCSNLTAFGDDDLNFDNLVLSRFNVVLKVHWVNILRMCSRVWAGPDHGLLSPVHAAGESYSTGC